MRGDDLIREVLALFADERNWTRKQVGAIRFTGGHSIPERIGRDEGTQTADWTTQPWEAARQALEKMTGIS